MFYYFDSNNAVNLSHIPEIQGVRPLYELKKRLAQSNFKFLHTTEYKEQGIYLIEISKIPSMWCARTSFKEFSFSLLLNIPSRVIKAAKQKKVRIVILSIVEGDNFTTTEYDGFKHLHSTVRLLGLPKHSVCIISGNLNAAQQYSSWCRENNTDEYIEFLEGIEWDGAGSWNIPIEPLILSSLKQPNVKSFNSLNRAHRPHRTGHLRFLAKNNLLDDNLVSGGFWFTKENVEEELLKYYPRTVDFTVDQLKSDHSVYPNLTSTFSTYINSLLTVVTESHYDQDGGLFITEKTFRPIALGHPFIVLGQPFLLRKLNSFGFKTNFLNSHDIIVNNTDRFNEFHKQLLEWKKMPYEAKTNLIRQWLPDIEYNFNLYKSLNFKKLMFDSLIDSTKIYFSKNP